MLFCFSKDTFAVYGTMFGKPTNCPRVWIFFVLKIPFKGAETSRCLFQWNVEYMDIMCKARSATAIMVMARTGGGKSGQPVTAVAWRREQHEWSRGVRVWTCHSANHTLIHWLIWLTVRVGSARASCCMHPLQFPVSYQLLHMRTGSVYCIDEVSSNCFGMGKIM